MTAAVLPSASATPSLDSLNAASPNLYGTLRTMVNSPNVPEDVKEKLNKGIDFLTGEGQGKPGFLVPENAPKINQFLVPTMADKCIGGESRSIGLATSVPGPSPLPLPGVPADQLGFIFTGLGTKPLAKQQSTEMNVYWINIANARVGKTTLTNNGINAESGPAAVNATADTGKGLVFAVLSGGITVDEKDGPVNCNYTPTAGIFPVG
nr:hypothetical protein [Corynebacterium lactis]